MYVLKQRQVLRYKKDKKETGNISKLYDENDEIWKINETIRKKH